MVPESLESVVRDFDLFLGVRSGFSSGCCAKDLTQERKDYVPCVYPSPESIVIERRIIDADGKFHILGPGKGIPLYHLVKKGYDFQI